MKNWLQLTVEAPNVRGTPRVVVGQYVSFMREGNEDMLIAGKDLAHELGYLHPKDQQEVASATGSASMEALEKPAKLQGEEGKRKYVLSDDTASLMRQRRQKAKEYATVLADGRTFLGEPAFLRV